MVEIERNDVLTSLLMLFAVLTFAYRYWDVFLKSYGERGTLYYKWTLPVLGAIHSLAGIFAIFEYWFFQQRYNLIVGTSAFLFFLIGQVIRNWAIRSLGKFHSPHIEMKSHHQLIQTGPYRYLRNPYYLGVLLEVTSSPLVLNSYFSFLFSFLVYVPILFMRVHFEGKILANHFGPSYLEYVKNVPAVFPNLNRRDL